MHDSDSHDRYGDLWAEVYDEHPDRPSAEDTRLAVAFLAALANGPALEFGIGTGRVALPLAAQGIEVHGIERSPGIADRLADKAGSAPLNAVVGDMTSCRVEGEFGLVYCVYNTLFMLESVEAQARCFVNAAEHLRPNGRFVVEALMPWHEPDGAVRRHLRLSGMDDDGVWLLAVEHAPQEARLSSCAIRLTNEGIRLLPGCLHYRWPPELDELAEDAGFELEERYSGWDRTPYSVPKETHVSVYRLRGRARQGLR